MSSQIMNLHLLDRRQFMHVLHEQLRHYEPKGGVYRLLLTTEDGRPRLISRLAATDEQGIAYIGACRNYMERVGSLFSSLTGNARGHDLGPIIHGLPEHVREMFKLEHLVIQIEPGTEEAVALRDYVTKFGEGPPLNTRTRGVRPSSVLP